MIRFPLALSAALIAGPAAAGTPGSCAVIRDVASATMNARQNGVSREFMQAAAKKTASDDMSVYGAIMVLIDGAFDVPLVDTPEQKRIVTDLFGTVIYDTCMKDGEPA